MGCESNNATAPTFAIADGAQDLDPASVARSLVERFGAGGMDPRVRALIPRFDAPFFQAGLAGYSDAPMRLIARRHGCPVCVTEALLDRTLLAGGRGFAKADLGELESNVPGGAEDHPLVGQIMGSDPGEMAAAGVKMIEQGRRRAKDYRALAESGDAHAESAPPRGFAAIDINLACPVKKIARKARGGHWLREPEGAIAILRAVRDALPGSIPVTVKMRRAYDETPEMRRAFLRVFDAAYDLGCAWVTLHGRTVEQKYVGPSRWDPIKELVERNPERIVFGSGDVWDADQIFRMIGYTGVAGVSVARGCIGNPWIFRRARDLLAGCEPRGPTLREQREVLETHFQLALAANHAMRQPELHTAKTMRKFAIRFAAHHPDPAGVKQDFITCDSLEAWKRVVETHY